jgi:uncharacterized integral membrane protein (TIGR00697 family)
MNELYFFGFFFLSILLILGVFRMGKEYIYGMIAVLAVLMNIFVLKPFEIFGLTTYGGNILYGCIFFCTDLLAEHYGKKEALKAVRIGFISLILYFIASQYYLHLETNFDIEGAEAVQSALTTIFAPAWGIVLASLSAFLISNILDVHIYDWIHKKTGSRHLWLRNNASTFFSQLVDTITFTFIAAAFGIFDWKIVGDIILFAYIFKILVAALDTPFLYLSRVIQKHE